MRSSSCSSDMTRLFGEVFHRTVDRYSRRAGRRLAKVAREIIVVVGQLEAPDNRLTLVRIEAIERRFVALHPFGANQPIERRSVVGRERLSQAGLERHAMGASPLTGDLVRDRLAQVVAEP